MAPSAACSIGITRGWATSDDLIETAAASYRLFAAGMRPSASSGQRPFAFSWRQTAGAYRDSQRVPQRCLTFQVCAAGQPLPVWSGQSGADTQLKQLWVLPGLLSHQRFYHWCQLAWAKTQEMAIRFGHPKKTGRGCEVARNWAKTPRTPIYGVGRS